MRSYAKFILFLPFFIVACGGGSSSGDTSTPEPFAPKQLVSISAQPDTISLAKGLSAAVVFKANYSDGSISDITGKVDISEPQENFATLIQNDTQYTVYANHVGTVEYTVTSNDASTTLTVNVTDPELVSLSFFPEYNVRLAVDATRQINVYGVLTDSSKVLLSDVQLTTSDDKVASLMADTQGLLSGHKPGTITLSAEKDDITNSLSIEVIDAQSLLQEGYGRYAAKAFIDESGSRTMTWLDGGPITDRSINVRHDDADSLAPKITRFDEQELDRFVHGPYNLVRNDNSQLVLLWHSEVGLNYSFSKDSGETWSPARAIPNKGYFTRSWVAAKLGLKNNGDMLAVWHIDSRYEQFSEFDSASSTWSSPSKVPDIYYGNGHGFGYFRMFNNGDAAYIWQYGASPTGPFSYHLSRYSKSEGWQLNEELEFEEGLVLAGLALTKERIATFVFVDSDPDKKGHIYVQDFHLDEGWSEKVLLNEEIENSVQDLRITVNSQGYKVLSWHDSVRHSIFAKTYSPEHGWNKTQQLDDGGIATPNYSGTFITENGISFISWLISNRAGEQQAFAYTHDAKNGWLQQSDQFKNVGHRGRTYYASSAFNQNGKGVFIWEEDYDQRTEENITYTSTDLLFKKIDLSSLVPE